MDYKDAETEKLQNKTAREVPAQGQTITIKVEIENMKELTDLVDDIRSKLVELQNFKLKAKVK